MIMFGSMIPQDLKDMSFILNFWERINSNSYADFLNDDSFHQTQLDKLEGIELENQNSTIDSWSE